MKNKKNKLLSLLIIVSLSFVGCSKQTPEEQVDALLTNDTVNIVGDSSSIDIDELDDEISDFIDVVTDEFVDEDNLSDETIESQVTTVADESTETNSNDSVDLTDEINESDNVIITEPNIEVLEAYAEVTESSEYSLSYNLTNNIDIESHIFEQVNELRVSLGISPVTTNNILVNAAFTRSKELPQLFSHTRPDGTEWYTIFDEIPYNFKACGENLTTGSGFTREQANNKIFDSWLNSSGHYANMVNPDFKEIGIAVYFDTTGTYYATQIFGTEF